MAGRNVSVIHTGTDDLHLEWVRIIVDDGTYVECADCANGGVVDNDDIMDCNC